MAKYYLCTENYKGLFLEEKKIDNDFVNIAFNKYQGLRTVLLTKGMIYHAIGHDEQIVDDYGTSVSIEMVKNYLTEFVFEIEDEVKNIIVKKPNDKIKIEPFCMTDDSKEILYTCTITSKNKSGRSLTTQTMSSSQYSALQSCYFELRTRTSMYNALFEWFKYGKVFRQPKFLPSVKKC